MPWSDYLPEQDPTLQLGQRYELVYAPEGLPSFRPDQETARAVIGGKPFGAVDSISVDLWDSEIHAVVAPLRTGRLSELFPAPWLRVVPSDAWAAPFDAVANLAGVEGWARLDRWRPLGALQEREPEDVDRADRAARAELDGANVRNAVVELQEAGRIAGVSLGTLFVSGALLWAWGTLVGRR